jgi:hypothetical protein
MHLYSNIQKNPAPLADCILDSTVTGTGEGINQRLTSGSPMNLERYGWLDYGSVGRARRGGLLGVECLDGSPSILARDYDNFGGKRGPCKNNGQIQEETKESQPSLLGLSCLRIGNSKSMFLSCETCLNKNSSVTRTKSHSIQIKTYRQDFDNLVFHFVLLLHQ